MPPTPHTPPRKPTRSPSFLKLASLATLSPLRTLLARTTSSPLSTNSSISALSNPSTLPPRIPQIHPLSYETHQSVNKLLETFTSRSIARSRRAKARLPPSQSDTYRSIHCGDQNCCFSSPYSFYRTRSTKTSGSTRKNSSSRNRPRSRSASHPNLRFSSLKSSSSSPPSPAASPSLTLVSSPPSISLHPFRRSLTSTGSSRTRRANSLFEGSPPPAGKLLTPLYEYPDPIGARSSSWLNKKQGILDDPPERPKSVNWAKDTIFPIKRERTWSGYYRPSGLSMFSWTASSESSESLTGKGQGEDEKEREVAYEWDGAFGWTSACKECGKERCVKCVGAVFEQIAEEGETATGVEGLFNICTPCVHGFCPGTKMWLRIRCGRCGEVGCDGCEKSKNVLESEG